MKLLDKIKYLFKHKHKYKFIQAWEAQPLICPDKDGKCISFLIAIEEDPILNEKELNSLVKSTCKGYKKRYLINLSCKCGHRISVEDTIYFPKNYV